MRIVAAILLVLVSFPAFASGDVAVVFEFWGMLLACQFIAGAIDFKLSRTSLKGKFLYVFFCMLAWVGFLVVMLSNVIRTFLKSTLEMRDIYIYVLEAGLILIVFPLVLKHLAKRWWVE